MERSKKTREREATKLDEELDNVPVRDKDKTPMKIAKLPKPSAATYNPDRVRASIPMNARAGYKPATTAKKAAVSSPKNIVKHASGKEKKAATYIEDLKK